jgi:hypothetical protein
VNRPTLVRAAIAKKHLDVDLDAVLALDAPGARNWPRWSTAAAEGREHCDGGATEGLAGVPRQGGEMKGGLGAGEGTRGATQ